MAKLDDHDPASLDLPMATSIVRKKLFVGAYCGKVHELKHKDKNLKMMQAWLHSNKELAEGRLRVFLQQRGKVIALLVERAAMGPSAQQRRLSANMISDGNDMVSAASTNKDSFTRRGKAITVRKFKQRYPDKELPQNIVSKRRRDGTFVQVVNMYDNSDSEWSFSEADAEDISHRKVIDDGSLVIDAAQQEDSRRLACAATLASGVGGSKLDASTSNGSSVAPRQAGGGQSGEGAGPRAPRRKAAKQGDDASPNTSAEDVAEFQSPFAKLGLSSANNNMDADDAHGDVDDDDTETKANGQGLKPKAAKRGQGGSCNSGKSGVAKTKAKSKASSKAKGSKQTKHHDNAQESVARATEISKYIERAKDLIDLFASTCEANEFDLEGASQASATMKQHAKELTSKGNKAMAAVCERSGLLLAQMVNLTKEYAKAVDCAFSRISQLFDL